MVSVEREDEVAVASQIVGDTSLTFAQGALGCQFRRRIPELVQARSSCFSPRFQFWLEIAGHFIFSRVRVAMERLSVSLEGLHTSHPSPW